MKNRIIVSREYKMMLKPEKFVGNRQQLLDSAQHFCRDFSDHIAKFDVRIENTLDVIKKTRIIKFHDTREHRLRHSCYLFRERIDAESRHREVTLKCRHMDRYISQDRDMSARHIDQGQTKFEQDIKVPFVNLYSVSTKQAISRKKKLNRLEDPARLFPGLKAVLDRYDKRERLELVGDFSAFEQVVTGAKMSFANSNRSTVECALIVWSDNEGDLQKPLLVEFSYRYGNKKERFCGEESQMAYAIYRQLQDFHWRAESAVTSKTQYVYGLNSRNSSALTN